MSTVWTVRFVQDTTRCTKRDFCEEHQHLADGYRCPASLNKEGRPPENFATESEADAAAKLWVHFEKKKSAYLYTGGALHSAFIL